MVCRLVLKARVSPVSRSSRRVVQIAALLESFGQSLAMTRGLPLVSKTLKVDDLPF